MNHTNVIGIVGAGQLGKMLAEAMQSLGIAFVVYDSQSDACARSVGELMHYPFDDTQGLDKLIERTDIVTCEFENVPSTSLEYLADKTRLLPSADAFAIASNRLREKQLFAELAIPSVDYRPVSNWQAMEQALQELGFSVVVKSCSGGYDGKGQVFINKGDDVAKCYDPFRLLSCIVERKIDFSEEVSAIVARSQSGQMINYPLTKNVHEDGILRVSVLAENHPLTDQAQQYVRAIAEKMDYVGVLALECFVDAQGTLLANEIAPRVHNSGHWTIEGCRTSQFENHIRAILNMPLGSTDIICPSVMINCLGRMPTIAVDNDVHVHDYGKQPRPQRKVGHVTITAANWKEVKAKSEHIFQQIYARNLPSDCFK